MALGVLFTLLFWAGPARSARKAPARVLTSAGSRLVFQVNIEDYRVIPSSAVTGAVKISIPGFVSTGNPGHPARPARKYLVGLPPGGGYSLSWRVLSSVSLGGQRLEPVPYRELRRGGELGLVTHERFEIDPGIYGTFQNPPAVSADEEAYIRRQRVLPVWVEPLTHDPSSGETVLATSIEIEITFSGGERAGPLRGSGRPTESPAWERVFSRLLVNAEVASKWRPAPRSRQSTPPRFEAVRQADALVKLKVRETGFHKVSAGTLTSAGFPAGRTLGELYLFTRGYDENTLQGTVSDIAYTVTEGTAGTPGVFDGDDVLIFHALRLRDDPAKGDAIEQYSDHNVYWLGTTSGPVMATRALAPGFLTADTLAASFPASTHFEVDRYFRDQSPEGETDFYLYNEGYTTLNNETRVDFPFEVDTVKPGTSLQLQARLLGQQYKQINSLVISLVNSNGTTVLNPDFKVAHKDVVTYQTGVAGSDLVAGTNTFRFEANPVKTLLNWLRVSYESLYRARNNKLRFNTASLSGDTSVTVTGLSDRDVRLFDITNPSFPVDCVLTTDLFTDVGDGYALTFRDNITSRKDYALLPVVGMREIGPQDAVLDVNSDLIGNPAESGVDVLVVSYRDFVAGMQAWVRYRRAQGYEVLMADVEDVYDEFNGGVPGVRGIDRFVRHFFELGNAGTVLLVGDSSEDNKRIHQNSPPSYVPSHARSEWVGSGFNVDEVITMDRLFVKLPGPTGTVDAYPDLAIGRFPVGNTTELQVVLNKVFKYEKPQASDFWRRRMILVADDAYSSGGGETGFSTTYVPYERYFRWGQEDAAQTIEASYPGGGYEVLRFYLDDYTWPAHPDTSDAQMYSMQLYTRANATPVLMNELRQGATIVSIQAHMNRHQIAHEKLLMTEGGAFSPNRDHLRMNNRDKPYIIFGLGCHFSDYAVYQEMSLGNIAYNTPNGDSFAEQLLLQNAEAAVATYGSSGFEYLGQTNDFMRKLAEVWFYNAPYDTLLAQTQGQWIFGELMYLVEIEIIKPPLNLIQPVERYHILGDPLLHIDAGPPRFDVTVDGEPVQSGDEVKSRVGGDNIHVSALVQDENSINAFQLLVDGVDRTQELTVRGSAADSLLGVKIPRGYEVSFDHQILPATYDLVLKAFQAPDTTSGQYHMAAEFVLEVASRLLLYANGRPVGSGDMVPARAAYRVELSFPVNLDASDIDVSIDDAAVADLTKTTPEPGDSTAWVLSFSRSLQPGPHTIVVTVAESQYTFDVVVSLDFGLKHVVNYPNPFTETTRFIYTNNVEISEGTIDVYTTSGKKVVRLEIPPGARGPGQNAVFWDGRDTAGDDVANGVYLYVVKVKQRGESSTIKGKLARIR